MSEPYDLSKAEYFEGVAELRQQSLTRAWGKIRKLRDENAQLKAKLVYAYNRGYMAGHHDTVEGKFTDIHQSDMRTYHDDVISEIAAEPE